MKRAQTSLLLLVLAGANLAQGVELIDPTRPVAPQSAASSSQPASVSSALRLEGIVFADQRRLAIINGKLLRAGDWLGDIRIQTIASDAVHYSRAGRSYTLRLIAPEMKVRRTAATQEAKQ